MSGNFMKKFIGNKSFYKMVLVVAVPIMVQNGITNLVSLLDNLMVGAVGTEEMSGVSIVNQLVMVFNLCIFGGISGAGIFTAQYFGQKDEEGIKHTFRYKLWIVTIITLIAVAIFLIWDDQLIGMYLNESSSEGDLEATLKYAKIYLKIILAGIPAFMIQQAYASTLRETGHTVVPMVAGVVAVFVNLVINALLIFGMGPFPKLGVAGAAIGTSISRYVEAVIVITWTHVNSDKVPYMKGIYRTLKVPRYLTKKIVLTGLPLLINEGMWSAGNAAMLQSYSERGLDAVAGMNIANVIINLFSVVFLALGMSVSIVVGKLLGAGKMEEAKDTARKMIFFSVGCSVLIGVAVFILAPFFPQLYKTTLLSKNIAKELIMVQAIALPQMAFINAAYFTMRSGGKTVVTFLFDSVFMWLVSVPITYILSRYTGLYVVWIFVAVQLADLIKTTVGLILVKKGIWIQNIVSNNLGEENGD